MRVSELWLRSFIDPALSAIELVEQFTHGGIEVDHVEFIQDPKQAIWTFKVPQNRGDCLSVEGIARELALLSGSVYQPIEVLECAINIPDLMSIDVQSALCPHYVGCVIKNIDPKTATPVWLKNRLEIAGMNSISVIVDVMNYVMLELGQPLHAFDLTRLDSGLVIRESESQESITLLNGQTLELKAGTLVIADKTTVQAVAGIVGGEKSAVTDLTTAIFIESAYFEPIAIRLAAQQYGLKTDASYRFERGVDPTLQKRALKRAVQLLVEVAGGKVGSCLEYKKEDSPLFKNQVLFLRRESIYRVLGVVFSDQEILELLRRSTSKIDIEAEGFKIYPLPFRQDLVVEVDFIEEIARLHGFHQFKSEKLSGPLDYFPIPDPNVSAANLKQLLASRGFYEVITYSFVDVELMTLLSTISPLTLANPIHSEMRAMRTNLWPGLLQAVCYNQRRQLMRTRFFELGNCFVKENDQFVEKEVLAGICAGLLCQEQWGVKKRIHDFYDLKEEVEVLLSLEGKQNVSFERCEHPALHPGQAARIVQTGLPIGYMGALHPHILNTLALEGPIFVFELDMEYLKKTRKSTFRVLSRFPSIRRDIAILVPKTVLAAELKAAVWECAGEFLQDVTLFDVYEGVGVEPNKKSVALSLILQHPSRTLVEEEVNGAIDKVVALFSHRFQATLRE